MNPRSVLSPISLAKSIDPTYSTNFVKVLPPFEGRLVPTLKEGGLRSKYFYDSTLCTVHCLSLI